jgi:hypothetical protein
MLQPIESTYNPKEGVTPIIDYLNNAIKNQKDFDVAFLMAGMEERTFYSQDSNGMTVIKCVELYGTPFVKMKFKQYFGYAQEQRRKTYINKFKLYEGENKDVTVKHNIK